jgi:hypothetical protein
MDYGKIFIDEESYLEGHGKPYETWKVSPEVVAVIPRPDQYVPYVVPMEDVDALNNFFAGFMEAAEAEVPVAKSLDALVILVAGGFSTLSCVAVVRAVHRSMTAFDQLSMFVDSSKCHQHSCRRLVR